MENPSLLPVFSRASWPPAGRQTSPDAFQAPGVLGVPRPVKTLRINPDGSIKGGVPAEPVNCGPYHNIEAVMDGGRLVTLEDGSIWQISDTSTKAANRWAGGEGVVVCGDKITDVDKHTTVEARRIK